MERPAQKLRLAFQGEHGAFSELAARKLAGEAVATVPCGDFADVFRSVETRRADAAIIPIENSLHGSVHENYDHLLAHQLAIAGETQIRIVHHLIAIPGVSIKAIKKAYSHPVALNQCLSFFSAHPGIERSPFYDTAGSVKMIVEQNRPDAGAIASSAAAAHYGAQILKRSIEDDRRNFTRFFLLMRPRDCARWLSETRGSGWKTSLVFTTKNRAGAIFRVLGAFALRDLSLTKFESRPLRGKPWEYLFYLDFIGNMADKAPKNAIAHLAEMADFHRVLGSYPIGK